MEDTPEIRKARGAFFTPPEICEYLTAWAIRSADDRVLEPSAGDAEFLLSAGRRLRHLGGTADDEHLHGAELHQQSVEDAKSRLRAEGIDARIQRGDFFEYEAPHPFDAVVGNPPFVRYQSFTGASRSISRAASQDAGVTLSGLASSWASFAVRSYSLLAPAGRLGLVLPAELLSVNYAAPVRSALMNRFAALSLVVFEERVFPGVTAEVVLLMAEGEGQCSELDIISTRNLATLADGDTVTWRWSPDKADDKWLGGTVQSASLGSPEGFVQLSEWGRVILGMVTGNNRYFVINQSTADEWGLAEGRDLFRVCPPGSRHLRGLRYSDERWRQMRDAGAPVFLYSPAARSRAELSKAAAAYEAHGRALGVDDAYKCRIRKPAWWRVPSVDAPDFFLTYMNYDGPRIVTNDYGLRHFNSVHGLHLHEHTDAEAARDLPIAFLNSLTMLDAELQGRPYGGGILKLEPKEAGRVSVPSAEVMADASADLAAIRRKVAARLAAGSLSDASALVDSVLLKRHLGYSSRDLRDVRSARGDLFARRAARAKPSRRLRAV